MSKAIETPELGPHWYREPGGEWERVCVVKWFTGAIAVLNVDGDGVDLTDIATARSPHDMHGEWRKATVEEFVASDKRGPEEG